jgi:hypothetical protein
MIIVDVIKIQIFITERIRKVKAGDFKKQEATR